VRQKNHIHMAGLALASSELTVAHAQMLLAVPMEALRPTPAAAVNAEYSTYLPIDTITDKNLAGISIIAFIPKYDYPDTMVNTVNTDALSEIPLFPVADDNTLAVVWFYLSSQFLGLEFFAAENNLTVELQITDIASSLVIYVIKIGGMGEPTIKGKIAGYLVFYDPINEPPKQDVMVEKFGFLLEAVLFLDETAKIERIMLAGGADIIGDKVVMGNFVPLFGVVPEIADILDEFADVVDKDIIEGNDTLFTITGRRVFLEPIQPLLVEFLNVPFCCGKPAVKTGLVGSDSELTVDGRYVLMVSYKQAGEILGEMDAFRVVGKETFKLRHGFLDDGWEFDDSWHRHNLHVFTGYATTGIYRQNAHLNLIFSILQKSSS